MTLTIENLSHALAIFFQADVAIVDNQINQPIKYGCLSVDFSAVVTTVPNGASSIEFFIWLLYEDGRPIEIRSQHKMSVAELVTVLQQDLTFGRLCPSGIYSKRSHIRLYRREFIDKKQMKSALRGDTTCRLFQVVRELMAEADMTAQSLYTLAFPKAAGHC